jgi:hypothetical protein
MLEHDVPAGERQLGADLREILDLGGRQPREERRIVGIQEVLYRSRCVVARHSSAVDPTVSGRCGFRPRGSAARPEPGGGEEAARIRDELRELRADLDAIRA